MPATSALQAIESSVAAEVQLTTGMAAGGVRVVPLSDMISQQDDGTVVLNNAAFPLAYPGATISLNDDDVQPVPADTKQHWGTTRGMYQVSIVITIWATSDGTVFGAARHKAWEVAEAALKRLQVFTPPAADFPAGTQPFGPLEPGRQEPITVDGNTHGVAVEFFAKYQIVGTTTQ